MLELEVGLWSYHKMMVRIIKVPRQKHDLWSSSQAIWTCGYNRNRSWNALYLYFVRNHWRKMAELCSVHFYSPLELCSDRPKSQAKILRIKAPEDFFWPMRHFFDERWQIYCFPPLQFFSYLKSNRFYSWGYISSASSGYKGFLGENFDRVKTHLVFAVQSIHATLQCRR